MRVSICPQGDFEYISDGCGSGDDYIWVIVRDGSGVGVPGIPTTDYWLQAADPDEELCLCASQVTADSVTNSEGRTTISGPISGGGCALHGLTLWVKGKVVMEYPACTDPQVMYIVLVSPDLNADCAVNLSDLGIFGLSYNLSWADPGYDPCCDYNHDNHCNLSDFAFIGEHYQHGCP